MPCNAAIVEKMKEIEPYLFLCTETLFQINPHMAPNNIEQTSFWRLEGFVRVTLYLEQGFQPSKGKVEANQEANGHPGDSSSLERAEGKG